MICDESRLILKSRSFWRLWEEGEILPSLGSVTFSKDVYLEGIRRQRSDVYAFALLLAS